MKNWTIEPYKYGLNKVLVGTDKNGTPHWLILGRGHPDDASRQTNVQWSYCGTDATEAHAGKVSLLPIGGDYCPAVTGHGIIRQDDVDAIRADGEDRLADVLQKIVDGKTTKPVKVTVTRSAMRGYQELPLDLIFLGDAAALAEYSNIERVEEAAVRLVAKGGTSAL